MLKYTHVLTHGLPLQSLFLLSEESVCDPDRPRAPGCYGFSPSAALGLSLADFITVQGYQLHGDLLASPAPPTAPFPSPQTETLGHHASSPKLPLNEFGYSGFLIPFVSFVLGLCHPESCRAGCGMCWNGICLFIILWHISLCGPHWPCTVSAFRLLGLQVCSITPSIFFVRVSLTLRCASRPNFICSGVVQFFVHGFFFLDAHLGVIILRPLNSLLCLPSALQMFLGTTRRADECLRDTSIHPAPKLCDSLGEGVSSSPLSACFLGFTAETPPGLVRY